jgi:hypothetical protein
MFAPLTDELQWPRRFQSLENRKRSHQVILMMMMMLHQGKYWFVQAKSDHSQHFGRSL